MKHKKTYADTERHPGEMTDFRRPAYSVRHPDSKYGNIQNMSTGQQNEAEYPESEYSTQDMSMAGKLIRAQGEQIRETPRVNRKHSAWIEDAKWIAERGG